MTTVAVSRCWALKETRARLQHGRLQADVDWLAPQHGLHALRIDGIDASGAKLLGVNVSPAAAAELSTAESYVRGDDLVATYEQTAARAQRTQLYWRVVGSRVATDAGGAIVVELQVSINTSLLDVAPTMETTSEIAGERLAVAGGILIRPNGVEWSYFEIVHPADRIPGVAVTTPGASIRHRLFGRLLEKGVILRARIRGAVLARTNDVATAEAVAAEFAASEPPLTT